MVLSENGPIEAFPPRALLQYIRISSDLVHRARKRGDLLLLDTGPHVFPTLFAPWSIEICVLEKQSERAVESFRRDFSKNPFINSSFLLIQKSTIITINTWFLFNFLDWILIDKNIFFLILIKLQKYYFI